MFYRGKRQKSRLPSRVLAGAPRKTGERLGDDLLYLDEKQKGGAGHSASLRDRLQHHLIKSRQMAMFGIDRRSLQKPGSG
jgi:hypothetical protein